MQNENDTTTQDSTMQVASSPVGSSKLGLTSYTTVDALGNGRSESIGISKGNEFMVAAMMRDMIYADKLLAFIREYTCNALDEHIKHGVERPVEITITESEWSIRDFAKGLSEDGIMEIFGQLFASSKRSCDKQTGMFGIGALSGHAYGPDFLVRSVFEGIATTYQFFLEGSGVESKGISKVVFTEVTDEPSGITVTVPLKSGDYRSALDKTLNFCRRSGGHCSINGEIVISNYKKITDSIFYIENGATNYIKCGWVTYPIPSQLNHLITGNRYGLFLEVPVGHLDVTPSRETIQITPRTEASFQAAVSAWENYKKEEIEKYKAEMSAAHRVAAGFGGAHVGHQYLQDKVFGNLLSQEERNFLNSVGNKQNGFYDMKERKRKTQPRYRSYTTTFTDPFSEQDTIYILTTGGSRLLHEFNNKVVMKITVPEKLEVPASLSSCFLWLDELPKIVRPAKYRGPYTAPKVFRIKDVEGYERTFTEEKTLLEFVKDMALLPGRYSSSVRYDFKLTCVRSYWSSNSQTDEALKNAQTFTQYAEKNRTKVARTLQSKAWYDSLYSLPEIVQKLLAKKTFGEVLGFEDARKLGAILRIEQPKAADFAAVKNWLKSDCFVASMANAWTHLRYMSDNPLNKPSVRKVIERKVASLLENA